MKPLIRTGNPNDAEAIARLNIQWGYPSSTEEIKTRLAVLFKLQGHELFVAEINSEVVGWLHVYNHFSMGGEPFAEIGGLVVDENHRQQGIGKILVEKAKQWTTGIGLKNLKVRTNIKRPEASIFYEKARFSLQKQQNVFEMQLYP